MRVELYLFLAPAEKTNTKINQIRFFKRYATYPSSCTHVCTHALSPTQGAIEMQKYPSSLRAIILNHKIYAQTR